MFPTVCMLFGWRCVCVACDIEQGTWAFSILTFIYGDWLLAVWCAICSYIQKKNKCRIITRISKAYATKCTLRWRFASAICWCKIYDFFSIFCCCFFWLVTTQTIPKKHETHLIFAQMIYFLWFTCCSCYIVFALRFFFCSYPLKA